MPRLTFSQSIAAGASFDPFALWTYRYAPWRAQVRLMFWTTAAGITCQAKSGAEEIQTASPVDIGGGAAGNLPSAFDVDPLDFIAAQGDLMSAFFTNTTAGALNVMGVIDMNPG